MWYRSWDLSAKISSTHNGCDMAHSSWGLRSFVQFKSEYKWLAYSTLCPVLWEAKRPILMHTGRNWTIKHLSFALTLNKLRGGTKCPKHFRTLTILSMMKYGLSILHVNFFFGVKNHSKIKFWGYWKRNVEKFVFEIFFSLKIKAKNFEIHLFSESFHTQLYFLMTNINSE